jgi:hypothetical protein
MDQAPAGNGSAAVDIFGLKAGFRVQIEVDPIVKTTRRDF